MDVLQILRTSFPSHQPNDSSLVVAKFHSGEAINQIADHASAVIDFRSFSEQEIAHCRDQIERLSKEHRLEVAILNEGQPLLFDEDAPAVQSFLAALREHTGKEVVYTESYGGTDGRYFAKYDIPCIIIEPNGGGRHAPTEWLLAEDLEKYYRLLERWLLDN
jgi:acetylornithine deacetylase/succinyl-diaminopimelate desuccinylase-like protein